MQIIAELFYRSGVNGQRNNSVDLASGVYTDEPT
jgi:hypothetical protein